MRAMLLAAGLGSRLRPITDTIPKCLVLIGGKPLLQIWLERLTEAGFGPFLINTHYLHEQVEEFVEKSQFKDQVTLVYEPELLGTAGTLVKNIDFFQGEDGMVLHADNYCLADLEAFREAHEQRLGGCEITMMTFRTDDPRSCGIVEVDERGVVVGFHEKVENPPGNLANGAVYIFSNLVFQKLKKQRGNLLDISINLLPEYIGRISSFFREEYFVDIGTVSSLKKVNNL
jgi:mannose-1-phosphate guanylyltransferase